MQQDHCSPEVILARSDAAFLTQFPNAGTVLSIADTAGRVGLRFLRLSVLLVCTKYFKQLRIITFEELFDHHGTESKTMEGTKVADKQWASY